jgi:hypothetical protein
MMRKSPYFFMLLVIVALVGNGNATVYDVAADFSWTSNPNGRWQYGYTATLGGPITLFDYVVDYPQSGGLVKMWQSSTNEFRMTPNVAYNTSPDTYTPNELSWLGHEVSFHPGVNGEYGVIRWTADQNGTASIDAAFQKMHYGETDIHILYNNSSIFDSYLNSSVPSASYSSPSPFIVKMGDTIDFAVGIGSDGTFSGDTRGLSATIGFSAVPLPSAIFLFAPGLIGLIGLKKRYLVN